MTRFTGNTVDEALQQALTVLQATKEQVQVTILEEGKKGFLGMGKKEAVIEVAKNVEEPTIPVEPAVVETPEVPLAKVEPNVAAEVTPHASVEKSAVPPVLENLSDEEALKELALYLTAISKELGAPALVKVKREADVVMLNLETAKQGLIIGKHGKVLNALQYLSQVFLHRVAENKISVVINVGDYRQRRQEILERLAKRTADKVRQTKQPVFLEPMPAFERKQIHSVLSSNPYVQTHSEGDEPYRYLVVEPVKSRF